MSDVKIENTNEHVTTLRNYRVTGAEPLDKQWATFRFLPDLVQVTFVNGRWRTMHVAGYRLKQDGTPGMARAKNIYSAADKVPAWATHLTQPPDPVV